MPDTSPITQIPPQPLHQQSSQSNSKNLVIVGAVVLVIVIGGGLMLMRGANAPTLEEQGSTAAAETETASGEVIFRYTDNGYEPSSIEISAGTTVTFINESSGPMWPASDNHPTHQILPEFDANEGVPVGGKYSHTFTKIGAWKLHDHIKPQHVGVIIVE